jgi:hypothetical protein
MLRRIYDKLVKSLIGDDIFVSYSRADGATYAAGLATVLAAKGFACRIDQWGTEPGDRMPKSLVDALRMSALLILIGSDGAAHSKHVRFEVRLMLDLRRPVVPIAFPGVRLEDDMTVRKGKLVEVSELTPNDFPITAETALWAKEIKGLPVSCESPEALREGTPSSVVIDRIVKSFTFRTRDQRLRISTRIGAIAFALMIAGGAYLGIRIAVASKELRDTFSQMGDTRHQIDETKQQLSVVQADLDAASIRAYGIFRLRRISLMTERRPAISFAFLRYTSESGSSDDFTNSIDTRKKFIEPPDRDFHWSDTVQVVAHHPERSTDDRPPFEKPPEAERDSRIVVRGANQSRDLLIPNPDTDIYDCKSPVRMIGDLRQDPTLSCVGHSVGVQRNEEISLAVNLEVEMLPPTVRKDQKK